MNEKTKCQSIEKKEIAREREKNNERKRKGRKRKIDGKGKIINKHNENITVNDK